MLLLQPAGDSQRTGELFLLRQLANTMKALHDPYQAARDGRLATGIVGVARDQLVDIHDRNTRIAATRPIPREATPKRPGITRTNPWSRARHHRPTPPTPTGHAAPH